LPREVFFFGFCFVGTGLPEAAARAFCFFVVTLSLLTVASAALCDASYVSVLAPDQTPSSIAVKFD
jgi:hypothetical protein